MSNAHTDLITKDDIGQRGRFTFKGKPAHVVGFLPEEQTTRDGEGVVLAVEGARPPSVTLHIIGYGITPGFTYVQRIPRKGYVAVKLGPPFRLGEFPAFSNSLVHETREAALKGVSAVPNDPLVHVFEVEVK